MHPSVAILARSKPRRTSAILAPPEVEARPSQMASSADAEADEAEPTSRDVWQGEAQDMMLKIKPLAIKFGPSWCTYAAENKCSTG